MAPKKTRRGESKTCPQKTMPSGGEDLLQAIGLTPIERPDDDNEPTPSRYSKNRRLADMLLGTLDLSSESTPTRQQAVEACQRLTSRGRDLILGLESPGLQAKTLDWVATEWEPKEAETHVPLPDLVKQCITFLRKHKRLTISAKHADKFHRRLRLAYDGFTEAIMTASALLGPINAPTDNTRLRGELKKAEGRVRLLMKVLVSIPAGGKVPHDLLVQPDDLHLDPWSKIRSGQRRRQNAAIKGIGETALNLALVLALVSRMDEPPREPSKLWSLRREIRTCLPTARKLLERFEKLKARALKPGN